MPAVAAGIRPVSTAPCTLLTWRRASADSRPKPTPTVSAITSRLRSAALGGSRGSRRDSSTPAPSAAAGTARPTPTTTGLNDASAAVVAGKVRLKDKTPSVPSSTGDASLENREVLLLSLMNNDSSDLSALASMEALIGSLPPDSKLPSYRELQQRYRLSPATVQRMLADLARRGLLVTKPGSGTFTAPRRAARPRGRPVLADARARQPGRARAGPGAPRRSAAAGCDRTGERLPRRAAAAARPARGCRLACGPATASLDPAAAAGAAGAAQLPG